MPTLGRLLAALGLLACAPFTQAGVITWSTVLGPEAPGASGSGTALVSFDTDTHVLSYRGSFTGLSTAATQAHFHCCTALPLTGTAGIAVDSPSLKGFPTGATAGLFDASLDLDDPLNFNIDFLTASGNSTDTAIARVIAGFDNQTAYLNIHTGSFPRGEIRGFLQTVPEPGSIALGALGLAALALRRRA